ncbi:hypothetical protein AAZX31_08G083700 [Glycine max]|uniref:Uncharacterized protein n=2 Tax=Glycine subgen. Soja TaxID=1462606 RepID=K7L5K6_SOYBN|nr:hypothetical protein JHK85_021270 [Glycine max]KHN28950.1 hypothetical protein glysoja_025744 [Glycine soja]KAG5024918.1 hypothetical protein JHK86_020832 [Glycine max]KAG5136088.1 hypothetical protein JHK82_020819 [Glycine max]KAH1050274.1 hypothetical protein GYH30_020652 [Glycine max]
MTQMWPLSSQKNTNTTSTVKMQHESANSTPTTTVATKSMVSTCRCCCLVTKLMRKLKRRNRKLRPKSASRQGSFQCRYDPLSYSLNFDTTGMDEDYYKFCAFSSRFVANPRTSCPAVQVQGTPINQ